MFETLAAALIAMQGGSSMPSGPPATPRGETRATPAAAQVLQPTVPTVPGKTLSGLPNATIRYFDVGGKNLKAINQAMARLQQPDSTGRAPVTPTAWAVDTTFNKITSAGQCKVTAAKATFSASVSLPRLVNNKTHTPQLLATWRNYLANIENIQATNLWFVYDHMRDVEKAILASSCAGAQAAGAAAVERLKAQAAEFERASAPVAPVASAAK